MTSPVDICQLALAEGATRTTINGFPPIDNSPAAVSARLFYTPKTQMLLRAAPWDSARRQAPLTLIKQAFLNGVASSNPPPQPWQYEYLWPADCLRARFIQQFQVVNSVSPPLTTGPQNMISPAFANTGIPFVVANDPLSTGQPRKVILRNMGGPQRLEFDSRGVNYDVAPGAPGRLNDDWFRENYKLEMIINCAVKPDGTPLFRMAQLKQLGMRNPKPIERLFQAARQLNGYAIGSSPIDSLSLSEGGMFAASSENSQEK